MDLGLGLPILGLGLLTHGQVCHRHCHSNCGSHCAPWLLAWRDEPFSFKRHRFPPEIIRHGFTLSFRDVEELLAERGVDVSYETVRRWFLKFGLSIAANIRRSRPRPSDNWHLDEMAITIRGDRYWLWRAVDNEGEALNFLVQRRRNTKVAMKLMMKLLKKYGFAPTRIVTDQRRSYHPAAIRPMRLTAHHD